VSAFAGPISYIPSSRSQKRKLLGEMERALNGRAPQYASAGRYRRRFQSRSRKSKFCEGNTRQDVPSHKERA
jgi:hypothetical protein